MKSTNPSVRDEDDYFAGTRMSFGDHLEELRYRMWAAVKGLLLCMFLGFILDMIGHEMGWEYFGVGKPALKFITMPIEQQMRIFNDERNKRNTNKYEDELKENSQRAEQLRKTSEVVAKIPTQALLDAFEGIQLRNPEQTEIEVKLKVRAFDIERAQKEGETVGGYRNYLTSLSITEGFMVYFKVTLLCGFILACPWIFWQFWAFIGAGLYPKEKRYVYAALFPSVFLFLVGIAVCQFLVMPGAVKALLGFNSWIDVDPDLRLREWLGFAILLPLVFGISFQTPLVMIVLNRIGMFTWKDYLAKWRIAVFILAIFAAVITPTPDIITMLYLFVPMMSLYLVGVAICWMLPPPFPEYDDEEGEEVAV